VLVELWEGHVIEDSACSAQTSNVAGIVELYVSDCVSFHHFLFRLTRSGTQT
jgi:hypothetical protein